MTVQLILSLSVLLSQPASPAPRPPVPDAVSRLVIPILDAQLEAMRERDAQRQESMKQQAQGKSVEQFPPQPMLKRRDALLTGIVRKRGTYADEALVVLLDYSLGEGEDVLVESEVTERGKRMLKYLSKYRSQRPLLPNRQFPEGMIRDGRQARWSRIIDYVRAGRVVLKDK